MIQDSNTPCRESASATWISGRWVLAAVAGMATSAVAARMQPLGSLSLIGHVILGSASGWLVLLLLAPWAHMRRIRETRSLIRELTTRLRGLNVNHREEPIGNIILDRADELGELTRVIHVALTHAVANRIEARMLHRTMHEQVRRETDRATLHLQRQATTDALTGLGNRRALDQRLNELLSPESRPNGPISAMALDLDRFKELNDTLGHEAGDHCLAFLGHVLRSSLRREDLAVRLGGDEFFVLMPGRNAAEARHVAERLSALFRQMPWSHAEIPRPSVSIGVASAYPGDLSDPQELVRRADAALYSSKRAGRARVTIDEDLRGAA
jgi:diguanylate cyclase (GGDEF)-like protein